MLSIRQESGRFTKSILLDTILAHLCTLSNISYFFRVVATRQISTSGKAKSPRVQVVLPEDLCERLATLAETESRTVSNMAKVLIQEGILRYEQRNNTAAPTDQMTTTEGFRSVLEAQQTKRLRGAPRRFRFYRP